MPTLCLGSKRDPEERIVPRSVDADDSDVDIKSDDDRFVFFISSILSLQFFISCAFKFSLKVGDEYFIAFHLGHSLGKCN